MKGTGCCLFIYKWRGHKDIHTYKQHILLALRVQLSEQLLRHCIQQHHLPVRWISSLLLSSQKWHTWTWWHQNSYKEYSETFGLLLANVLEQYERKKKNVMWFAVHSRLFSLLKVIWIKGICAFFYSFLATSIHSGVGSCLKECTQSQSSTLIYDLIDKVSMGEVYNQFCTNFIFPSAVMEHCSMTKDRIICFRFPFIYHRQVIKVSRSNLLLERARTEASPCFSNGCKFKMKSEGSWF